MSKIAPDDRYALIAFADRRIREARRFQIAPNGLLTPGYCYEFWQLLNTAGSAYLDAGLSLLAGRVAFFARRVEWYGEITDARDLWEKFDRLNAGTTSFEEGGRA